MTIPEWEQFVQSLRNEKEKKDKTLNERTNRFWSFILDRNYNWKQVEDEVKELLKLKKSDLVEFSHKFLNANSTKTSRLSIQVSFFSFPTIRSSVEEMSSLLFLLASTLLT